MGKSGKWRDRIVGDYNWRFLCMPTPPWKHDRPLPPFFGHNEKLSFLVAIVMGLQHALAMASSPPNSLKLSMNHQFKDTKTYLNPILQELRLT